MTITCRPNVHFPFAQNGQRAVSIAAQILFVPFRKLHAAENEHTAGRMTATDLLATLANIYGRNLDKRITKVNQKVIDGIEAQTEEDLLHAMALDKQNEGIEQAFTQDMEWASAAPIIWDVMGSAERQALLGMTPTDDVVVCMLCDQTTTDNLALSCGCVGGCTTCYDLILNTTRVCPTTGCGETVTGFLRLKNALKTKSRELIQAEAMQQEYIDRL